MSAPVDVPSDPRSAFGTAKHPDRPPEHARPDGVDDAKVRALGKLSEALEVVEDARGLLYEFHRLSGMADLTLQDAVEELRDVGQTEIADTLDDVVVGRDVVRDMWTFQIVEAYDAQYWTVFRSMEAWARREVHDCPRHLFEAEVKVREQQSAGSGRPAHRKEPGA